MNAALGPMATTAVDRAEMAALVDAACNKIAPLWPLKHFVAVNPFLGFSAHSFAETCATLRRVARTDMLMPRGFYREALAAGVVDDSDLASALTAARADHLPNLPHDLPALRVALDGDAPAGKAPLAVVATVAEVLDRPS